MIFKRVSVTSISEVIYQLKPVVFPTEQFISSQQIVELKRQITENSDAMIAYVQNVIGSAASGSYHEAILLGLRKDILQVRLECAKVKSNFSGSKHRSKLKELRAAYEEMRLAAVLVCQHAEPILIDSFAGAL